MNLVRSSCAAALVAWAIQACPVSAAQPDEAFAAFLRGDYAAAYPLLEPLAMSGDPQAQYFLALMFDGGQGVQQDVALALKWYRSAAAAGLVSAQFTLAQMYESGQGVARDDIEALTWLERAATRAQGAQRNEILKTRDRLSATMTAADIADAQRRASEPVDSSLQYRQSNKPIRPAPASQ